MKRYLPFIVIAAIAGAAVAGGAVLFRVKRAELTTAAASVGPDGKPDTKPLKIRGNAKAAITIEEFGDFECPPCETLSQWLPKMEREYSGKVRLVFRNFPLRMHKHAAAAACASEAAGLQGRFWEMHDTLYRNRAVWAGAGDPSSLFADYAREIGIDVTRFKSDAQGEEVKARVQADQLRGTARGVTATPTVFLNNRLVAGPFLNEKGFRTAIDDILSGKTPAPGPSSTSQPFPTATNSATPNKP